MATSREPFTSAAEAYDHHVGRYGTQLAAGLVEVADIGPGHRVLDVAGVRRRMSRPRPGRRRTRRSRGGTGVLVGHLRRGTRAARRAAHGPPRRRRRRDDPRRPPRRCPGSLRLGLDHHAATARLLGRRARRRPPSAPERSMTGAASATATTPIWPSRGRPMASSTSRPANCGSTPRTRALTIYSSRSLWAPDTRARATRRWTPPNNDGSAIRHASGSATPTHRSRLRHELGGHEAASPGAEHGPTRQGGGRKSSPGTWCK